MFIRVNGKMYSGEEAEEKSLGMLRAVLDPKPVEEIRQDVTVEDEPPEEDERICGQE